MRKGEAAAPPRPRGRPRKARPADPVEPSPFVSIEWVIERYTLTRPQVLRLVDRGQFPPALDLDSLPGRTRILRFRRAEVEAWEAGRWIREGDLSARSSYLKDSIRQPEHQTPAPSAPRRREAGTSSQGHQPGDG